MPFDFNNFINTSQFSDPAAYAGFSGQMSSVEDAMQKAALAAVTGGAIKPPSGDASIGDALMDYGNQAIKPIQQGYQNAVNKVDKYSSAASNTLNGNKQNLVNPESANTLQQSTSPWNLSLHLGLD